MNELITVEIDSKNKQKLLNVLHESNLIVEILNEEQTYVVIRDKEFLTETVTVPQTPETDSQVTLSTKQTAFNYNISETV
jgi:hypothetical protein